LQQQLFGHPFAQLAHRQWLHQSLARLLPALRYCDMVMMRSRATPSVHLLPPVSLRRKAQQEGEENPGRR